jgi:hypothetical protein
MRASVFELALAGVSRLPPGFAAAVALGFICSTSASAQTPDVNACALPFPFPAEVIEARVLMVSDVHGTHETSGLAGELACTFARSGGPVTVAIEMSRDEQTALDVYLESDGGEAARSALISRPYWETRALASVATLAMIERLRALRRSGTSLSLIAIDASSADLTPPPTLTPEQEEKARNHARRMMGDRNAADAQLQNWLNMIATMPVRNRVMAQLLGDAVRSDPARRFVVLLDRAHISKLGVPLPGVDSMASILASEGVSLTSLTTIFLEGSLWGCPIDGGNCGPLEFPKPMIPRLSGGRSPGVYLSGEFPGYDGLIVFGRVTAAEPANPAAVRQASRE